jgi:hypothetical protein
MRRAAIALIVAGSLACELPALEVCKLASAARTEVASRCRRVRLSSTVGLSIAIFSSAVVACPATAALIPS